MTTPRSPMEERIIALEEFEQRVRFALRNDEVNAEIVALRLLYYEETGEVLPIRDIAEMMGLSTGAICTRLRKMRKSYRECNVF